MIHRYLKQNVLKIQWLKIADFVKHEFQNDVEKSIICQDFLVIFWNSYHNMKISIRVKNKYQTNRF